MHLGQAANQKTKLWIRGIASFFIVWFLASFWHEIIGVFQFMGGVFLAVLGFSFDIGNLDVLHSLWVVFFNCTFGFLLVFSVWLLLISQQAILPVKGLQEIYRTAWHMVLYITHKHGPAVFIKDGQMIASPEELDRPGHGVMVIDFNSAVLLEERDVPPGFSRIANTLEKNWLYIFGLADRPISPRVCGPGIVFTRPGERVRGVVDLRRQFRMQPNVTSYTRDGIELTATNIAIFTIGQDPDTLQVTCAGPLRPDNLRVITFKPVENAKGFLRVSDITDELDAEDREEIYRHWRMVERNHGMLRYEALTTPPAVEYNAERVFNAVFAKARSGEQEIPWTDLPLRVASGFYREILSTVNYDELYDLKGNGKFPLPSIKSRLRLQMRNNGILAFRMVMLRSNSPFIINSVYREEDLIVSEPKALTNPKMLRDRGIKIFASSFGDPVPVSQVVYKQRLDSWRAKWESEMNLTLASRELEAMRLSSRAHADAQQDLWYALSQLFESREFTDEALALRVLQALERAAADPKTRQLLPANTLELMTMLHNLLIAPPTQVFAPPPVSLPPQS